MEFNFSTKVKDLGGNAIREIFKLLAQPDMISFAGGFPTIQTLPVKLINEFLNEIMASPQAAQILQYGATEGYMPLRAAAIEYVKQFGIHGIDIPQTLIVSGGQQAIDLMCKAFLNKGDVVLVEDPTYLAVLHIIKTYEGRAIGVKSTQDGLDIEDLQSKIKRHKPKFLYVVPTFSNPTGKTYSAENRKKIAELTAKLGLPVLEDDPYSRIRFEGKEVPSLKSYDKTGNIVFVASFSKLIAPGLRTAICVGHEDILRKMTLGKQASDVHTGSLNQAVVCRFLQDGLLDKHIKTALPIYKEKKDAMIDGIKKYMPAQFSHTNPEGGLFIWGEIDKACNFDAAAEFANIAQTAKVAYVAGNNFFADSSGKNTLRLNYSNANLQQIEQGLQKMGAYIKNLIS